ncbi:MAG: proton-conducting transporter membrane subunit [Clostridia bacterium]|nr:proton-conducting transporter membrane subunit [Clostridia bacterium]
MNLINSTPTGIMMIPLIIPLICAILILFISEKTRYVREFFSVIVTAVSLWAAIKLFKIGGDNLELVFSWFSSHKLHFKLDYLSMFLLFSVSMFSFLISIYSISIPNKGNPKIFYFLLLLTQVASSGVVLSDNLLLMLFFWESMVIFLYIFIYISSNSQQTKSTALKTFLINGIADISMMIGIAMIYYITSTLSISEISKTKIIMTGWGTLSFFLILIGTLTKAGAFPFHTWIPQAALYSNASFMAYIPAAIDKLLGIYFLARISLHIFQINLSVQIILMIIASITIIAAVMMALIQTDYKRLLSYHAVSQTGYMILGISTLNPIGIAGGLFHMINHATYKSCLFMTAGSVERQTQINDISKLGGLFWKMPATAICFIISAAAISGIAPLNGYFSKELVYKGTLNTGYTIFFYAAEIGSVLTLASFLKLGHSVFFGKLNDNLKGTKEAPLTILLPMIALSCICIIFGFGAHLPLSKLIQPSIVSIGYIPHTELSGFHLDNLFLISITIIIFSLTLHISGFSIYGKPYKTSDHIHYAPIIKNIYQLAEKGYFDLYEIFKRIFKSLANILFKIDRFFDIVIDKIPSNISIIFSSQISYIHRGIYNYYMLAIFIFVVVYLMYLGGIKW